MDTLVIYLILGIITLFSFALGVFCLIKYAKTKSKIMLISGILLTFILPGILLYLIYKTWIIDTMIVYGPPPMIDYGPEPPPY